MEIQEEELNEILHLILENFYRALNSFSEARKVQVPSILQNLNFAARDFREIFGQHFQGLSEIIQQRFLTVENLAESRKRSSSSQTRSVEIKSENDNSEDFDVSGCPLESPFDLSIVADGIQSSARAITDVASSPAVLHVGHGRFLLNSFSCHVQRKNIETPLGCLYLCDARDPQKTALIGAVRKPKETTHFVAYSSPSVSDLKTLKKKHFEAFPKKNILPEAHATAFYEILEPTALSPSAVKIQCKWKDPLSILELPKMDATCKLNIQLHLSAEDSSFPAVYKELSVLKGVIEGLESGEILWTLDNKEDEGPMDVRIRSFIEDSKKVCRLRSSPEDAANGRNGKNMDACIEALLVDKRQNMDFTENLWNILKDATSLAEVQEAFAAVKNAVLDHEIHPFALRRNTTSFGRWINSTLQGEQKELNLDGIEPLLHFAEIGLCKLQKDYSHFFMDLDLTTKDLMSPFIQCWEEKEMAVQSLCLLHAVLELVVLCHAYLHLQPHLLSKIARQALKDFQGQKAFEYSFSCPISFTDIQQELQRCLPSEWQVSLTSSTATYTKKTILHHSLKALSHLQATPTAVKMEEKGYHSTMFVVIKDSL